MTDNVCREGCYRGSLDTTASSTNSSSHGGEKTHHWALSFNPQKEGHYQGVAKDGPVTKPLVAGGTNGCIICFDSGMCKHPVQQAL